MDLTAIGALPKALLHDHLDGGLRIGTVLELADAAGHQLPADDEEGLAEWFHQGESGSLEQYLGAFAHTVAVMRTPEALDRVAYETVLDYAADGVVYAEVRFAPSLVTTDTMPREAVLEAAIAGLDRGSKETGVVAGVIATAMRQDTDSDEVVRAAERYVGEGLVGFDLAGPEAGYPPDRHLAACRRAREAGIGLTIHAGEGDGVASIWKAVGRCGAQRVGHGARIIEDTRIAGGSIEELGGLARSIRDQRIPLELCITSNLHTGLAPRAEEHPFGLLHEAGFAVTLNTDNRLMSGITLSHEYQVAAETFGLSLADLGEIVVTTLSAGFGDWEARRRLIREVVEPAYALA